MIKKLVMLALLCALLASGEPRSQAFMWTSAGGGGGVAAPAYACSTVTNTAITGALSCVRTGDTIVAISCGNLGTGTQTITCPSGFTDPGAGSLAGPSADANHLGQKVCYKYATAADTSASTYTFTYNGTGAGTPTTGIMDFRSASPTWDAMATNTASATTSMTANAITTTLPHDQVVMAWCAGGVAPNSGYTFNGPPSGYSNGYVGSGSNNNTIYTAYAPANAAGSVASQALTFSTSASGAMNTFSFGGTFVAQNLAMDFSGAGHDVNSAGSSGGPWTVTIPSKVGGCPNGDLVLLNVNWSTNNGCATATWSPTLPTGFAVAPVASGNNPATFGILAYGQVNEILYKVASSEPSSYIFTQTGYPTGCSGFISVNSDYGLMCISGVNAGTPIEKITELETNQTTSSTSYTLTTTSITTTKADMVLPSFWVDWQNTWTSTVPTGYISLWNFSSGNNKTSNGSYLTQGAAGAVSPSSVFSGPGQSGHTISWLVTVEPQ